MRYRFYLYLFCMNWIFFGSDHARLQAEEPEWQDCVASISMASGKPESIGKVKVLDNQLDIISRSLEVGGTKRSFWRLGEGDEITFSLDLPEGATNVSARIFTYQRVKQKGGAKIVWNDQVLGDEEQPYTIRPAAGGWDIDVIHFDESKKQNLFKLVGLENEILFDVIEFRYCIPYPSWKSNGVTVALLAPIVESMLSKENDEYRIDLRWTATGPMENGWIKIEYRAPDETEWQTVPGGEGFSYGSPHWPTPNGSYTWKYKGDCVEMEFRVLFNIGPNLVAEQLKAEKERAKKIQQLTFDLLASKRKFIDLTQHGFDSALWKRHAAEHHWTFTKKLDEFDKAWQKPDRTIDQLQIPLTDALLAFIQSLTHAINIISEKEEPDVSLLKDLLSTCDLYEKMWSDFQKETTEQVNKTLKETPEATSLLRCLIEDIPTMKPAILRINITLGRSYYNGKGVKQNYKEAIKFLKDAADSGDAESQSALGLLYAEGKGVTQDDAEAVRWFRKADQERVAGERKTVTVKGVEYAFRWCPAGTLVMGSGSLENERNSNETQHKVMLTQGFWMLETEVTQEMWESVMGSNPSHFKGKRLPVESVSWNDCQEFITKLNALFSKSDPPTNVGGSQQTRDESQRATDISRWVFSLPTEAQWEYACRADTTTAFHFGNVLNGDKANCDGNYPYGTTTKGKYLAATTSAGSYPANAWGLFDMHSNVREWCLDWYGDYLYSRIDPTGPEGGTSRVSRGGSWYSNAMRCRSAFRDSYSPGSRYDSLGFRPCLISLVP